MIRTMIMLVMTMMMLVMVVMMMMMTKKIFVQFLNAKSRFLIHYFMIHLYICIPSLFGYNKSIF